VRLIEKGTACSIDTGDAIRVAHIDLLARMAIEARNLRPPPAISHKDSVVYGDSQDGAVMTDRGPDYITNSIFTMQPIPHTIDPIYNLVLSINTNIFVFASSGHLSEFTWYLLPFAANAEFNIDVIV